MGVVERFTEDNSSDFDNNEIDHSKTATAATAENSDILSSNTSFKGRDFGKLLSIQAAIASLTNEEKYQLLKHSWTPSADYKIPMVPEGMKNRSFQRSW